MSSQIPGFRGREIADVQQKCFLRDVPRRGGRFRYPSSGLSAPAGTLILFQLQAHIIASAIFLRDLKFKPARGEYAGELHLEPASIRIFDPLDLEAIRIVWPRFRAFGHVKQYLNPECYSALLKHLKRVKSPPAKGKSAVRLKKRTEI
jgi:hypothetical protein